MYTIFSFFKILSYRTFFYFIIPTSTVTLWLVKNQELLDIGLEAAIISMIYQLVGIYVIGAFWLLMYVLFKVGLSSSQKDFNTITTSEHFNTINYQKTVFAA